MPESLKQCWILLGYELHGVGYFVGGGFCGGLLLHVSTLAKLTSGTWGMSTRSVLLLFF